MPRSIQAISRGCVSPANNVSLRFVGEGESGTLSLIHAECFPHYWNREAFTDFFNVKGTFALLAENEAGEPMGMTVVRPSFEQADLLTIAVRPAFQRGGIARLMLHKALEKAKEVGVRKLFLEVEVGNEAAVILYKNEGFSQSGLRKLYYRQLNGTYTDALVMQRKLY